MKKTNTILFCLALLVVSFPTITHADSKFMGIWWWESHWKNQDFKPHYDNGTDPQNSQWKDQRENTNWTPADWIKSVNGDGTKLVEKWLNSGIIKGSYKDSHKIPYLEIGPNFYHLSGYDKRRVTETLDSIYQVTSQPPHMYFIKDPATRKVIGTYSKEGLTLE